jgi:hypothetical protein
MSAAMSAAIVPVAAVVPVAVVVPAAVVPAALAAVVVAIAHCHVLVHALHRISGISVLADSRADSSLLTIVAALVPAAIAVAAIVVAAIVVAAIVVAAIVVAAIVVAAAVPATVVPATVAVVPIAHRHFLLHGSGVSAKAVLADGDASNNLLASDGVHTLRRHGRRRSADSDKGSDQAAGKHSGDLHRSVGSVVWWWCVDEWRCSGGRRVAGCGWIDCLPDREPQLNSVSSDRLRSAATLAEGVPALTRSASVAVPASRQ